MFERSTRGIRENIEGIRQANIAASERAGAAAKRTHSLERRLERQELLLEALIRGVLQRNLMTREELQDLVARADLEDGREDGRMGPDRVKRAPKCPNCKRPVNPRREDCVYCGAEIPAELRKNASRRQTPYRR